MKNVINIRKADDGPRPGTYQYAQQAIVESKIQQIEKKAIKPPKPLKSGNEK